MRRRRQSPRLVGFQWQNALGARMPRGAYQNVPVRSIRHAIDYVFLGRQRENLAIWKQFSPNQSDAHASRELGRNQSRWHQAAHHQRGPNGTRLVDAGRRRTDTRDDPCQRCCLCALEQRRRAGSDSLSGQLLPNLGLKNRVGFWRCLQTTSTRPSQSFPRTMRRYCCAIRRPFVLSASRRPRGVSQI
jgi:hypothetical protein